MADVQMAEVSMVTEASKKGGLANLFVLCAMAAFSLALTVGFHRQLGLPMWLAGGVAGSIFAGCLAMHLLLLRSVRLRSLEAEVAQLKKLAPRAAKTAVEVTAKVPASNVAASTGDEAKSSVDPAPVAPGPGPVQGPAAVPAAQVPVAEAVAVSTPASPAKQGIDAGADFETIQSLVKKLADEVEANERQAAAAAETGMPAAAIISESAIAASVDALKTAAESMHRPAAGEAPATTSPGAADFSFRPGDAGHYLPIGGGVTEPAPTLADQPAPRRAGPELIALAGAIQGQRIDVMLQPILGLREQAAAHYEVSLRLRDERGDPLDILDRPGELSGTGLLPLIDIARLTRTAEVTRRLKARGNDGSVFSDLAVESLVDEDFLNRVADAYRVESGFAQQLVMSFAQSEARALTSAQWETLRLMRDLGFRFALKDITDLDMDFDALVDAGLRFAKLDAEVFLVGLPLGEGILPSRDICAHLDGAGLSLIVGHIEDEKQLGRIIGFGVLLGQGRLFGEPRPMRAELFQRPESAAA